MTSHTCGHRLLKEGHSHKIPSQAANQAAKPQQAAHTASTQSSRCDAFFHDASLFHQIINQPLQPTPLFRHRDSPSPQPQHRLREKEDKHSIKTKSISKMAGSDSMYIASVVGTYWVVSISMVYLNKILMSNDGISIPAPLFVTWFQCVVTVLICWLAGLVGDRARSSTSSQYAPVSVNESGESTPDKPKPGFFEQFPKAEYLVGNAKQVFPLTLIFGKHIGMRYVISHTIFRIADIISYHI